MRRLLVGLAAIAVIATTFWVGTKAIVAPPISQRSAINLAPQVVRVERGDLRSVLVLKGTIGGSVHSYQAVAIVEPDLLYRFYDKPVGILVKVDKGPAPFDCAFISLEPANGPGITDPTNVGPVILRCRIPDTTRVFAGLPCLVAVTTAAANNVLLIPVTAVEGLSDVGYVTVVGPTGAQSRRQVHLGISDGTRVQVTDGLSEGEQILDLPPSVFPSDVPYGAGNGSS